MSICVNAQNVSQNRNIGSLIIEKPIVIPDSMGSINAKLVD